MSNVQGLDADDPVLNLFRDVGLINNDRHKQEDKRILMEEATQELITAIKDLTRTLKEGGGVKAGSASSGGGGQPYDLVVGVTDYSAKPTANGGTRYGVKFSNGTSGSSFDDPVGKLLAEAYRTKSHVRVWIQDTTKDGKTYHNIKGVDPVAAS